MGSGAFMQVYNSTGDTATIWITNVSCFYQNGEEGSNLQAFNGAIIGPGKLFPPNPVYIEAKGSGGCWFTPSHFNLGWEGREPTISVGSGDWVHSEVPGIGIQIVQGRDHPQAKIIATLYKPGSPEAAEFEKPAAT
jgi:hypothetical protein